MSYLCAFDSTDSKIVCAYVCMGVCACVKRLVFGGKKIEIKIIWKFEFLIKKMRKERVDLRAAEVVSPFRSSMPAAARIRTTLFPTSVWSAPGSTPIRIRGLPTLPTSSRSLRSSSATTFRPSPLTTCPTVARTRTTPTNARQSSFRQTTLFIRQVK